MPLDKYCRNLDRNHFPADETVASLAGGTFGSKEAGTKLMTVVKTHFGVKQCNFFRLFRSIVIAECLW